MKEKLFWKWMDFKFAVKVFFIRYGTTAKKFTDHTLSELEEMGLGDCPTKKNLIR